jgi:hypothetical protein
MRGKLIFYECQRRLKWVEAESFVGGTQNFVGVSSDISLDPLLIAHTHTQKRFSN